MKEKPQFQKCWPACGQAPEPMLAISQALQSNRTNRIAIDMKEGGSISLSVVSNSASPWTVAHQAPLSKGFSRQEY